MNRKFKTATAGLEALETLVSDRLVGELKDSIRGVKRKAD